MNANIKNLLIRTIAALVFAPVFLLAIHLQYAWATWVLAALCLTVAFFALREYFSMASANFFYDRLIGEILGLALAAAVMLEAAGVITIPAAFWKLLIPTLVLLCTTAVVFHPLPLAEGIKRSSTLLFGIVYGGLFICYLYLLRLGPDGRFWAQTALFSVWCCDTGAYFAGRTLGKSGKHKFAKNLSPKKSWEGFIGGIIAATALALFTHYLYEPSFPLWQAALLGAAAGIMGPIGDLAESLLKRSACVKDSGNVIPGHGGILDRFDAVIFVAPLFYIIRELLF